MLLFLAFSFQHSIYAVLEIDQINILQASLLAMKNSIEELLTLSSNELLNNESLCYALVDGNKCPNKLSIKSKPVVRGDALVYPIALASIVAKVERDHIMVRAFARHVYRTHIPCSSASCIQNAH